MNVRHRIGMVALAASAVVIVGTFSVRAARFPAQTPSPAQTHALVQTIAPGRQLPPGEKGATYYWLESQTTRLTTKYADGTAKAERDAYGKVSTVLTDASGNEVGRFEVNRADGLHDTLRYVHPSGAVLQAAGDPNVRPTLDWSNQQVYHLWKDKVDPASTKLEWQNGMMRPRGAAARDAERAIVELETEWTGGLSAKTARKSVVHHEAVKGRFVDGEALATRLTDTSGNEIGVSYWYARPQVFVWSLPSLGTGGFIGPEHLQADYGGWPFTPDMAWMNLQAMAFHHFKTLINQQRFVAERRVPRNRILEFFAPTVSANEDGCDDLHWLDNTVLRYCCDIHDRCYEKAGCTASSWWRIYTSWLCDYCNMEVIRCFLAGGLIGGGGPGKIG